MRTMFMVETDRFNLCHLANPKQTTNFLHFPELVKQRIFQDKTFFCFYGLSTAN